MMVAAAIALITPIMENRENTNINTVFSVNDWIYSKSVSLVRNAVYCFDLIWEEKENYDKIIKEKRHSELLFDVISHDIGNYHQIIRGSLDNVSTLFKKNYNTSDLSQINERIFSSLSNQILAIFTSLLFSCK